LIDLWFAANDKSAVRCLE